MTKRKNLWLKIGVILRRQRQNKPKFWVILVNFFIVIALEYLTPSKFVFGYFYTGSILLANSLSGGKATLWVTVAAIFFDVVESVCPDLRF